MNSNLAAALQLRILAWIMAGLGILLLCVVVRDGVTGEVTFYRGRGPITSREESSSLYWGRMATTAGLSLFFFGLAAAFRHRADKISSEKSDSPILDELYNNSTKKD